MSSWRSGGRSTVPGNPTKKCGYTCSSARDLADGVGYPRSHGGGCLLGLQLPYCMLSPKLRLAEEGAQTILNKYLKHRDEISYRKMVIKVRELRIPFRAPDIADLAASYLNDLGINVWRICGQNQGNGWCICICSDLCRHGYRIPRNSARLCEAVFYPFSLFKCLDCIPFTFFQ